MKNVAIITPFICLIFIMYYAILPYIFSELFIFSNTEKIEVNSRIKTAPIVVALIITILCIIYLSINKI